MNFNRSPVRIGIDIGNDTVKVVKVADIKNKVTLLGYALLKHQSEEDVKSFLNDLNLKQCHVRVSLNDDSLRIRPIVLPIIPEKELGEAIKWEMREVFQDEPYIYRYIPIVGARPENSQQTLMVFYVKEKRMSEYHTYLRDIHVRPAILEPALSALSFSVSRCFNDIANAENTAVACLEIGATNAFFYVIHQTIPVFLRPLAELSGNELTKSIARDLNCDEERAEQLKLSITSNVDGSSFQSAEAIRLKNTISNFLSKFSLEIQRSLDAYLLSTEGSEVAVDRLVLSGGGSYLFGIVDYLQKTLGMRVDRLNPINAVEVDFDTSTALAGYESMLSVSMGLVR